MSGIEHFEHLIVIIINVQLILLMFGKEKDPDFYSYIFIPGGIMRDNWAVIFVHNGPSFESDRWRNIDQTIREK